MRDKIQIVIVIMFIAIIILTVTGAYGGLALLLLFLLVPVGLLQSYFESKKPGFKPAKFDLKSFIFLNISLFFSVEIVGPFILRKLTGYSIFLNINARFLEITINIILLAIFYYIFNSFGYFKEKKQDDN